jgi:hypothetical protein
MQKNRNKTLDLLSPFGAALELWKIQQQVENEAQLSTSIFQHPPGRQSVVQTKGRHPPNEQIEVRLWLARRGSFPGLK